MTDEKKPRNVEDVAYAELAGERPMRQVLRDRTVKARKFTRKQLETAYRARAREIALLGTCLCCFPLVRTETASGHEDWCPTESMRRSFEAADASNPDSPTDTKGTRHGT